MFNGRAENERSLTAPLPAPRFVAWWVWCAVGFAGLIAALWWAGTGRTAWDTPLGFLGRIFGGLGAVFQPGAHKGASIGARLAFFLVLLLLLYLLWRATRAWLAYKPGAVDVQQLEDATPAGTAKPCDADLTARLRRRLSDSSMYPPATLPAQAPAESFLELLGDVEIDPDKLGTALPKLLGRLRPKLAYRVSGVLQFREAEPDRYGMTVTVTAFLFGGSRATTVWGSDWDDVVRKAGSWIISTMLPVTRAGRLPPWRQWWGREIKPELYEAYQEANELCREGRHHEALEQYFSAVRLDPTNPYLRAELAETQEKMGLHIDALDTCQRALTLDGQNARGYRKRLWQSRWNPHWRRLRYFRHPRLYRELLGLRYRNSIILGTSEETAEQWCGRKGTNGERTHEHLIPLLADRYWPTAVSLDDAGTVLHRKDRKKEGREWLTQTLEGGDKTEVRLVMQRAAIQETTRLAADDTWARVWLYWPSRMSSLIRLFWPAAYYQSVRGAQPSVTRGAFQINRRVWAPLRLAWASTEYGRAWDDPQKIWEPQKWRRGYAWRRPGSWLCWGKWLVIPWLGWRLRVAAWLGSRRDWHTHYNSACVYAVAMHADGNDGTRQKKLAERTVAHLEQSVQATRRSFATVERSWMVEDDPDLKPLRKKDTPPNVLFNNFVRTAYPRAEAFEPSTPSSRSDEQLREYDYRLLEEIAKVMQQVWNQRSEKHEVNVQCATEWLRVERKIWKSIRDISADENKRKWQDRVTLIRYIQANCQPMASSLPEFPPPLVPGETASPNGLLSPSKIRRRLAALQHAMEVTDTDIRSTSDEGQRILREAAVEGVAQLGPKTVRRLSTGYAAVWQTLDDWLEEEARQWAFRQALSDVPHLTRRGVTALHDKKGLRIRPP
ncbi:tetratricopeptide repeat protein [Streptomyces inhibens]|uniref:tetratricopeptide repeat protein n=1 Tax=Streptomyces inhibens TaxID=2293571 RepID=UPI001EE6D479|nr:tetratricopeptide repeat protein [Streptomyces inhibens]UKY51054.1 tetratricopeptide repeat protein [Streptomyces inhibens]